MKVRVYYEDTDVGGIVYHANYLKFCERARSEIFFKRGLSPIFDGYAFVVRKIEANFLKPAKLGDLLEITTKLLELRAASLLLLQQIFREKEIIFEANIELVFVKNEKICKIPKEIREIFMKLE